MMETIIEWTEVETLIREALKARGVPILGGAELSLRLNNKGKKQTCRLVFKTWLNPQEKVSDE